MQKVKFYDKELLDLAEVTGMAELGHEAIKEIVSKFLFSGFCVFSGFQITQNVVPDGQVLIGPSLALSNGAILHIPENQTINILDNSGTWGTGLGADATHSRYSIVCIKYAEAESQNAVKWFLDDTDPANPTEFQQTVNTRLVDSYDIIVVHGNPSGTPAKPEAPEGYIKIAEILVANGATNIQNSAITNTAPAPVNDIAGHIQSTSNPHGVTAEQIGGADILTELKKVDGTGSGLDADTLDGKSSTEFAPASHTHEGGSSVVIDNVLTSTATDHALSAAQGKVLKDAQDAHAIVGASTLQAGHVQLYHGLDSTDVNKALTAAQGKALKDAADAHLKDYVRQPGYAVTGGTSTAYTATLSPVPDTIPDGFKIMIIPHVTCGDNPTINVNSKGATSIKTADGSSNLMAGDMVQNVPYYLGKYGTSFFLSSAGGQKISGAIEVAATFGETIAKGDPVVLKTVYDYATPSKLPDPSVLPSSSAVEDIAWSPNGEYLAIVNRVTSPYVDIYKRTGDTLTRLANPATLPTSGAYGVTWSPDSVHLVVAHYTSPYITIYKRNGDVFTKLSNPSVLPSGNAVCAKFTSNGNYLMVGHYTTPFISVYLRSGDTFTKQANLESLPTAYIDDIVFSYNEDFMIAVCTLASSMLYWKDAVDAPYPDDRLFTGTAQAIIGPMLSFAFSPDGKYIALGYTGDVKNLYFYRLYVGWGGLGFTEIMPAGDVVGTMPSGSTMGVDDIIWSDEADGQFILICYDKYIRIYRHDKTTETFTDFAYIYSGATSDPVALSLYKDATGIQYLAFACDISPYMKVYKIELPIEKAFKTANLFAAVDKDTVAVGYAKESGIVDQSKKIIKILA